MMETMEKEKALPSRAEHEYGNLMTLCREVYGTEVRDDREREQMCTLLTRQIRKVREGLTDGRRRR